MDKLNVGVNGKKLGMVCMVLLCIFGSTLAQAAGVDTANSSLTSMKTWLDTWIPLACAVVLRCCASSGGRTLFALTSLPVAPWQ